MAGLAAWQAKHVDWVSGCLRNHRAEAVVRGREGAPCYKCSAEWPFKAEMSLMLPFQLLHNDWTQ